MQRQHSGTNTQHTRAFRHTIPHLHTRPHAHTPTPTYTPTPTHTPKPTSTPIITSNAHLCMHTCAHTHKHTETHTHLVWSQSGADRVVLKCEVLLEGCVAGIWVCGCCVHGDGAKHTPLRIGQCKQINITGAKLHADRTLAHTHTDIHTPVHDDSRNKARFWKWVLFGTCLWCYHSLRMTYNVKLYKLVVRSKVFNMLMVPEVVRMA